MTPDPRVPELAAGYAAIPEVMAVALGGSRGAGRADALSDIDLYVYGQGDIPLEPRRALAEARSCRLDFNHLYWEPDDEWLEQRDGLHVDIIYRRTQDTENTVRAVLDEHRAGMGYTTAVLFNLQHSQVLFDREGWLGQLQVRVNQAYPDGLRRAIVRQNWPLLRGMISAYPAQIEKAVKRGDIISVNHRLTEFLSVYFDILFALNRVYHPGEKRLLTYTAALPCQPQRLTEQLTALLSFQVGKLNAVPAQVAHLTDDLEARLRADGLL